MYKTHIYVIGTINPDERKEKGKQGDKAHEIYVKKPNALYMFLAKATQLKINPAEMVAEIHKHTNLCMYHLVGCCPHVECCYSHEEKACGLLTKSISAMNEKLPADCHHKLPSEFRIIAEMKDMLFKIFKYYTSRGQTDLHKLLKNSLMDNSNPELTVRAMRILRQVLFRQIHFLHPSVKIAVYFLSPRGDKDSKEYIKKMDTLAEFYNEHTESIREQFDVETH